MRPAPPMEPFLPWGPVPRALRLVERASARFLWWLGIPASLVLVYLIVR